MSQVLQILWRLGCRAGRVGAAGCTAILLSAAAAHASPEPAGGEANLKLPDLSSVNFLGMDGHKLLLFGILFCIFGLALDRKSTRLNSSHP
jgi:K(+)-stimulated pyrophosphate-energized sodium pump